MIVKAKKNTVIESIAIVVPTLRRASTLSRSLGRLLNQASHFTYSVLIANNASDKMTQEVIEHHQKQWVGDISYLNQPTLLDFHENLFSAIANCSTDFVCLMSDEDDLSLPQLGFALEQATPGFDFISPIARQENRIYRGRSSQRRIQGRHILDSSFYMSGLIFRTKYAVEEINRIHNSGPTSEIVHTYPQVALAVQSILSGTAYWSTANLIQLREHNSTAIQSRSQHDYSLPAERLAQADSLSQFILEVNAHFSGVSQQAKFNTRMALIAVEAWTVYTLLEKGKPKGAFELTMLTFFVIREALRQFYRQKKYRVERTDLL